MASRTPKSFTNKTKDTTPLEPITFELEGEEFEAYGQVPGAVLLDFIAASNDEEGAGTAKAIQGYLKSSMDPSTYRRFDKLTRDPKVLVPLSTLADIVGHLIEKRSADRPTD